MQETVTNNDKTEKKDVARYYSREMDNQLKIVAQMMGITTKSALELAIKRLVSSVDEQKVQEYQAKLQELQDEFFTTDG